MADFSKYPFDRINIEFIDSDDQRYPTIGDYWLEDRRADGLVMQFRSSRMPDYREAFACILHELTEAFLILQHGIPEPLTAEFDKKWEAESAKGGGLGKTLPDGSHIDEPGDDPEAPYYAEHRFGDIVERMYAVASGLPWAQYEMHVEEEYEKAGWNG